MSAHRGPRRRGQHANLHSMSRYPLGHDRSTWFGGLGLSFGERRISDLVAALVRVNRRMRKAARAKARTHRSTFAYLRRSKRAITYALHKHNRAVA